jgi:TfoX/Sxy family transcriptional regulator of competence genes/uncharacterized protein YqgQ
MELDDLYNIYRANIKVDEFPINENISPIKVGDILVALYNNREIRGEVSAVYENHFLLKGKNSSSIKITIDDVTEHYPKNRQFENKISVKKFTESVVGQPNKVEKSIEKPIEKVQQKKKRIIEEEENQVEKNSPDNSIDLAMSEKLKPFGKLIYYKNIKYSEIENMFEKKLLSREEYWYLLTEKADEIHIIRNNERAFEIQPFMNALLGHFLKSQNKLINESYGQIKISGNNNFSVIKNIPQNVHKELLNNIILLLSGVKET